MIRSLLLSDLRYKFPSSRIFKFSNFQRFSLKEKIKKMQSREISIVLPTGKTIQSTFFIFPFPSSLKQVNKLRLDYY